MRAGRSMHVAALAARRSQGKSGVARRARHPIVGFHTNERKRQERGAHNPAAGPQGPPGQGVEEQDARAEGFAPAPGRVHPRLHDHAEEAELRAAQGRSRAAVERRGGHRVHPRRRPQPPGALDRPGARRTCEGPPGCALQDHPRLARHPGREEPQAGTQPLRREEGEELMPRKGPAPKRPLDVDPVFGSPVVTQLVSKVLKDGKKQTAQRIVYGALEGCRDKTGTDPVVTLKRALDNVKPALEGRSRRVGGATYQVPVEVRGTRSMPLALRWLVGYSAARREKTMAERLMNEILDASNGLGAAVKRREDTHKMAESNKAFAHYRW